MENEYGITVANKYALFLNEDEDSLEILKLQSAKKSEKTKKSASKEKEAKPSAIKQNGSSAVVQDKKTDKVDQFSSPTVSSEPVVKSAGVPVQSTGPTTATEGQFESGRVNRAQRDRAKPRSNVHRDIKDQPGEEVRVSSEAFHDNRPPRIRARSDRGASGYPRQERRGFGENRQFRPENEGVVNENAERPNSIGNFERRERRPPRNGFSDQSARPEGDRFNVETSEQSGGRGDRADRDGYGGRGYSRRGGYSYRGRIRPDRNHFSEQGDQERTTAGFEDNQGRQEERQAREGFNDNDGGNFMERPDREGFVPRRDSRGRRGGFGRGRGGYDRPPRRDYQRFGDRRQRSQEAEGETVSEENKLASTDEPKQQQQHDNLHEAGSSWAEQIDAADQEAKKENSNLDEEVGDDANEAGGEPDVMTLDEWKAREDNKRVKAEFNIRKPGEGYNTDPQWKKMFVLSKKERAEEPDEEDEQEEEHHNKARNVIPIEIHFADDSARGSRGRGGGGGRRGGMGGPRGRGGRGGPGAGRWESDEYRGDSSSSRGPPRGGRGSYNDSRTYVRGRGGAGSGRRERTPNFADESDFPSLGSNTQP